MEAKTAGVSLPRPDARVTFGVLSALGDMIGDALRVDRARVAVLEARIAELEAKQTDVLQRGIRYSGAHQRALGYQPGDVVTSGGSLWIAVGAAEPGDIPGKAAAWQLAVKSNQLNTEALMKQIAPTLRTYISEEIRAAVSVDTGNSQS